MTLISHDFSSMPSTARAALDSLSEPACPIRACHMRYSFTSLGLMSMFPLSRGGSAELTGAATEMSAS